MTRTSVKFIMHRGSRYSQADLCELLGLSRRGVGHVISSGSIFRRIDEAEGRIESIDTLDSPLKEEDLLP